MISFQVLGETDGDESSKSKQNIMIASWLTRPLEILWEFMKKSVTLSINHLKAGEIKADSQSSCKENYMAVYYFRKSKRSNNCVMI